MLMNDLVITGASGKRVDLPTQRAYDIVVNNTKHGFGSIQFKMRLSFSQFALLYGNPQVLDVQLKRGKTLFNGRLEDIDLNGNVVTFTALGYWRTLSDIKYTELWSDALFKSWFTVNVQYNAGSFANRTPEKYSIDYDNRLYMALTKGTIYGNVADVCAIGYRIPNLGTRNLLGIFISLEMILPANWNFRILSFDNAFNAGSVGLVYGPLVATGVLQKLDLVQYFPLQTNASLVIEIFNNTGGFYNMAGETGTEYAKITDLRVVTTDNQRWVNTTFTVARAAGGNVTATVGSTTGMYVGQRVVVSSGLVGVSETVTVLSIGSATQFNATFVNNHGIGEQVSAVSVYPDQIVNHIISRAYSFNTGQLSSNASLVQTSSFDLLNEVYTDTDPTEIIDYLCSIGDGTQRYEAGVLESKQVYFRPRGNVARQWYIDYNNPKIKTSINQLFNNVYSIYKDIQNTELRSATSSDSNSITKYGIQRQYSINVNTNNATLANTARDLNLTNLKTIIPQATITIRSVLTTPNTVGLITEVRPGDFITVLNLPAVIQGTALDKLRTFRVVETKLHYDTHSLDVIPELTLPTIDYQLANLLLFAGRLPNEKANTLTKNLDRRQT